jgi:hypothetical protein
MPPKEKTPHNTGAFAILFSDLYIQYTGLGETKLQPDVAA